MLKVQLWRPVEQTCLLVKPHTEPCCGHVLRKVENSQRCRVRCLNHKARGCGAPFCVCESSLCTSSGSARNVSFRLTCDVAAWILTRNRHPSRCRPYLSGQIATKAMRCLSMTVTVCTFDASKGCSSRLEGPPQWGVQQGLLAPITLCLRLQGPDLLAEAVSLQG